MSNDNEEFQDKVRDRLWKNIGLAADIMEAIEKRDSVDEDKIESVLDEYTLASEADGLIDVFQTEMFRSVKCLSQLNDQGTLEKKRGEEMNESFQMLKQIAKNLEISVR